MWAYDVKKLFISVSQDTSFLKYQELTIFQGDIFKTQVSAVSDEEESKGRAPRFSDQRSVVTFDDDLGCHDREAIGAMATMRIVHGVEWVGAVRFQNEPGGIAVCIGSVNGFN